MNLSIKILLVYVILSYIIWFGLIIYAMFNFKKMKALEGNVKSDFGYLLILSVALGFAPLTLPLFLFNLIKDSWIKD